MTLPTTRYRAYGLTIASELDLSELPAAAPTDPVDVTIRFDTLNRPNALPESFSFSPDLQCIDFAAVGKFDIRGDNEIIVDPNPDLPDGIVKLPLLGSVFALLLHIRGAFVLHASAVRLPGGAVAFLGDKRAGKSTSAASMISRGYPLVTDDVLALSFAEGLTVIPGFPQIKLTRQSEAATDLESLGRLPLIEAPGFDKHQHNIANHFVSEVTQPLRLYLLNRGDAPQVEKLTATQAFQGLMRYSYLVRFGKDVLATKLGPVLMRQAADLAARNIVRCLTIPDDLDLVSQIPLLVERDLET